MNYAPPNAEILQRLLRSLGQLGHQVTVTLFEDESVRLTIKAAGQITRIALGVPW